MKYKNIWLGLFVCLLVGHLSSLAPPSTATDSGGSQSQPIIQQVFPTERETDKQSVESSDLSIYKTTTTTGRSSEILATPERPKTIATDNKEYPVRQYSTLLTPNDPLASQWWTANARLNESWDIPTGPNQALLAIIDTGFALSHEEFEDRWYKNLGESGVATTEAASILNCTDRGLALDASCNLIDDNGDTIVDNEVGMVTYQNPSKLNCTDRGLALDASCNLIDDDNNSLIDDVRGWDFVSYDSSAQAGELNPSGDGVIHGTAVTGVAAATGNNAKGIAGVDWGTKILPLQALDDDSIGDTGSVGRAIKYAADQGADIISISLGSDLPDEFVRQAVQYAIASGSIVVAASGNDGCDCMVYPAQYPEVLAVGALHTDNRPASFSSFGVNLDLLAPGTGMTLPVWSPTNATSAYRTGLNGTSFATPLVSGLLTRLVGYQPDASPLQLMAALTENTNRLGLASSRSYDPLLGSGTIDTFKALQRMITPRNSNHLYAFTPVSKGDFPKLTRSEVANTRNVHACEGGTVATTPLFELTKADGNFFSVSRVEHLKARNAGYGASAIGFVCMQQPHDAPSFVRSLNLFKEIRNVNFPFK